MDSSFSCDEWIRNFGYNKSKSGAMRFKKKIKKSSAWSCERRMVATSINQARGRKACNTLFLSMAGARLELCRWFMSLGPSFKLHQRGGGVIWLVCRERISCTHRTATDTPKREPMIVSVQEETKEEKKPILYDFILSKKGPNLRLIYY